jgi:hypothetical protein
MALNVSGPASLWQGAGVLKRRTQRRMKFPLYKGEGVDEGDGPYGK